ncbi:MAG: TlpA family protein disulfide reductase [Bacteroidota bacterium]|nr:TlpA family protein disulfide reductase [Bacteroidota bacterium]
MTCFFLLRSYAQEITIVKIEDLKKVYEKPNDTTYIINFFATWCGPCMMEMPVLNEFYRNNKNTSKQLIFVSLDNSKYLKKLPSFIKKLKIEAPVYLLNESSDFSWLPLIDKRWQGSIPATMVVNNKKHIQAFFETPLEQGQLEFYLKKLGL